MKSQQDRNYSKTQRQQRIISNNNSQDNILQHKNKKNKSSKLKHISYEQLDQFYGQQSGQNPNERQIYDGYDARWSQNSGEYDDEDNSLQVSDFSDNDQLSQIKFQTKNDNIYNIKDQSSSNNYQDQKKRDQWKQKMKILINQKKKSISKQIKQDIFPKYKPQKQYTLINLGPLIKFKNFINKISKLKDTPIRSDVIVRYTKLLATKLNNRINYQIVQSYIKDHIQRIQNNKQKNYKWNMYDVISLLWIVSKIIQYKEINENNIFNLQKQDYEFIDQVFQKIQPKSEEFLGILKDNKYTDRWSNQESILLCQIGMKYVHQNNRTDFDQISKALMYRNRQPLAIYRCPIQCQKQWKRLRLDNRHWTVQEDDKLLRLVYAGNNERPDWRQFQQHFQLRSQSAMRTRFYVLVEKMRAICPYSHRLSKLQLIKQKLDGRINIDADLTVAQTRKIRRQFRQRQSEALRNRIHYKNLNTEYNFSKINKASLKQLKQKTRGQKNIAQLLNQLQIYMEGASYILSELKRLQQKITGRVVFSQQKNNKKRQNIKNSQADILSYKRQRKNNILAGQPRKIKNKPPIQKNNDEQVKICGNKIIYKNQDFQVIKQIQVDNTKNLSAKYPSQQQDSQEDSDGVF